MNMKTINTKTGYSNSKRLLRIAKEKKIREEKRGGRVPNCYLGLAKSKP